MTMIPVVIKRTGGFANLERTIADTSLPETEAIEMIERCEAQQRKRIHHVCDGFTYKFTIGDRIYRLPDSGTVKNLISIVLSPSNAN